MDAVMAQVNELTSFIPPAVVEQLQSTEFWIEYFPLIYVFLFPLVNLIIKMSQECSKHLSSKRSNKILKRYGTVALPPGYAGVTSVKDVEGGKVPAERPAPKDGVNAHAKASPPKSAEKPKKGKLSA